MADQPVVQVSRLLDERGLTSFQITLLIWSFFLVLIDGYDIAAIAFAAPHLVKEWALKPGSLGPVFSASLIGILFGSGIFGWMGDRYGRKAALVWSNLLFGVFTLAAAYATSLDQMFWLHLLAGLGIGGVIPNVVAINAESAPRRLRATLAIIAVGFVPLGGAIPGFVTAALVPAHGWQIIFLIGGVAPIVIAVAATVALAGASLQVGGTVGALLLCWWLQKHRFLAVTIMFVIAVPVVAAIGYAGLTSKTVLLVTIFFAGFLVLGIQSGINVIGAMVYPTSLRANGSGWQLGVGRIGSIVGPLAGAALVGLPIERLYMWSALPFVAGAVICFIIYRLNEARLKARPELRDAQ